MPVIPAQETRICPYCKEEIRADAVKCKHCHSCLLPEKPSHGGTCPFCKEEIKPDAVKCKHCKSDLWPPAYPEMPCLKTGFGEIGGIGKFGGIGGIGEFREIEGIKEIFQPGEPVEIIMPAQKVPGGGKPPKKPVKKCITIFLPVCRIVQGGPHPIAGYYPDRLECEWVPRTFCVTIPFI